MIPVMIVDDETLLRSLIIRSIDWAKIGLEVVCEAADGEEALAAIEAHRPAIAIVDINMPFMNGLELTRIISEKYPGMQVIILTGYSDFEYARDAIRAKAVNYITKPIDEAELTRALAAAGEVVRAGEERARQLARLQTEAYRGQMAAQDKYLRLLFNGHLPESDARIAATLASWGCDFGSGPLLTVIISLDQTEPPGQSEAVDDMIHLQYAIGNIAQEIYGERRPCMALLEVDLTIVLLLGLGGIKDDAAVDAADDAAGNAPAAYAALAQVVADSERILALAQQHLQVTPALALGSVQERFSGVPQSFRDAVRSLRRRFYQSDPVLFCQAGQAGQAELWPRHSGDRGLPSALPLSQGAVWPIADFITIMMKLQLGDEAACLDSIRQIFENARAGQLPEEHVRGLAMNLASICCAFMAERKIGALDGSFGDMVVRIQQAATLDQLEWMLLNQYASVLERAKNTAGASRLHPMVRKALDEIEQHHDNPSLSLEMIARTIFVNPSYLSNLFHHDMGKTLTDYLIEYRMNRAYRLVTTESRRDMADIAAAVGYRDVYYFSRCSASISGSPRRTAGWPCHLPRGSLALAAQASSKALISRLRSRTVSERLSLRQQFSHSGVQQYSRQTQPA